MNLVKRHWLKVSISLTVVMGITWIIGVLVIEVEELFPLAYIFTIFVAFQGLFIFIFFVLLQKPVRESYAKWWKATVSESNYLSKYFGQTNLTSTLVSDLYHNMTYIIDPVIKIYTHLDLSGYCIFYSEITRSQWWKARVVSKWKLP